MKKVLLTTVLGLSLLAPSISFAGVNALGVQLPLESNSVESNVVKGSHIAVDNSLVNTLVPAELRNSQLTASDNINSDSYYVFGVDIKANNLI